MFIRYVFEHIQTDDRVETANQRLKSNRYRRVASDRFYLREAGSQCRDVFFIGIGRHVSAASGMQHFSQISNSGAYLKHISGYVRRNGIRHPAIKSPGPAHLP
jgi:hypothetical protein